MKTKHYIDYIFHFERKGATNRLLSKFSCKKKGN